MWKWLVGVMVLLLAVGNAIAAELEYKVRIKDWPERELRTAHVCLAEGDRVRLHVFPNFLYHYPAQSMGSVTDITQTWPVSPDFEKPDPADVASHGTFNLATFKRSLADDGRSYVLEFDVPEHSTSITLTCNSWRYLCKGMRKQERTGAYTVMIHPFQPATSFFRQIPIAEAPQE